MCEQEPARISTACEVVGELPRIEPVPVSPKRVNVRQEDGLLLDGRLICLARKKEDLVAFYVSEPRADGWVRTRAERGLVRQLATAVGRVDISRVTLADAEPARTRQLVSERCFAPTAGRSHERASPVTERRVP
ncbi:hypothetical protein [Streptomyces griseoruber]|uniref:hypothetical protein n=1 Tax=Streptomyces griseoruber TaxID=1943 RepID=UPI0012FEBBB8|nr:hypothetical protein [Streptomyces griseoruber]